MTSGKTAIDLGAYFRRIGYEGPRTPTLETLAALHRLHPQAIAFENLAPLLSRPVQLDLAFLEEKLVRRGRGGYCFEHNLLFSHVLTALGFRVAGLAARVLWNRPEDAVTPRSHMLLRVELADGLRIADVGFGGVTLTAPLRLEAGIVQPTPHETFRLAAAGADFKMQANITGNWTTLYRFDLQEQFPVDYEIANYFLSTNPASRLVNMLIAARPTESGRYALLNNRLAIHPLNGPTKRRELTTTAELWRALEGLFGIALPDRAALDSAAVRLKLLGGA
jgi:N-hydroxyarylamine O-acetyltransferase